MPTKKVSIIADPQLPQVKEAALRGAGRILKVYGKALANGNVIPDDDFQLLEFAFTVINFYHGRVIDQKDRDVAILNCIRYM